MGCRAPSPSSSGGWTDTAPAPKRTTDTALARSSTCRRIRGPRWRSQLAALDADARRNGPSFSALPRDRRQALVRGLLQNERGDALPNPLLARHVALALLAHFYDSPAATDLCYDAQIGRQQCRPLAAQQQQPVALGRKGR